MKKRLVIIFTLSLILLVMLLASAAAPVISDYVRTPSGSQITIPSETYTSIEVDYAVSDTVIACVNDYGAGVVACYEESGCDADNGHFAAPLALGANTISIDCWDAEGQHATYTDSFEVIEKPECVSDEECASTEDKYCKNSDACSSATTSNCVDEKCVSSVGEEVCTPCEYGCGSGECQTEAPPEQECVDSDGGKNYYVRGKAEVPCTSGPCPLCSSLCAAGEPCTLCEAQSDWCSNGFILNEGYCEDASVIYEEYNCPEGCEDGACIGEVVCPAIIGWRIENNRCVSDSDCDYDSSRYTYYDSLETCEEILRGEEPEPRPVKCATRISISFDKNVYYLREEFKVVMETFDAQGNHLPHYPFYIQIYDYESGTWQEIGQDRTDGSGYKIHQDKMNVDEPLRFGKNKIRVITKATGCPVVEDIAIIEIKRKEGPKPVPCGMGSCVPEPEPIDVEPVNISDGKGFYSCPGCEAEGKCYPVGYRKAGQYCDVDHAFVAQRNAGECDNSFECKANVCISGECLTENFVQKIIGWLKAFFGMKPRPPIEKTCSKLLLEHNIGEYKYIKSMHGEAQGEDEYIKEQTQAPLFSEDGKHLDTIKCCAAMYKDKEDTEHGVLFCPYDSKEDVTNSVKWIIAKERFIVFKEYEGHKVFGDDKNQLIAWINNAYLIAVGVGPLDKRYLPLPEDIANAYLKKYPSELELTEDDIPSAPPERPWVYCTEEDEKKGEKCESQAGAQLQTDPNPENKSCEVYVGCILPHEKCERIDDIKEKEDCYVGVAEMTGDSSVCEKITSDMSRKDKCYVKAAEFTKDAAICEKIIDYEIKRMCFELAGVVPWTTCTSEEDILKEECHFTDDFESGLGKWVFSSEGAGSAVVEDGNTVLKVVGVERANIHRVWDNYLFKFRFKRIDGSVHVDFRRSEAHTYGAKRYLVAISGVGLSDVRINNLNKQVGEDWRRLEDIDLKFDNSWHTLEIRCYDDIINVYADNELIAKHKDTASPLLSGWVRFELHTGGIPGMVPEFLIDDVEIKLITEEDIIYP